MTSCHGNTSLITGPYVSLLISSEWFEWIVSLESGILFFMIMPFVFLAYNVGIVLSWGVILGIGVTQGSCVDQKTNKSHMEGNIGISTETTNIVLKRDARTARPPIWLGYFRRVNGLAAIHLPRNVNVTHIPARAFSIWPETQVIHDDVMALLSLCEGNPPVTTGFPW